MEPFCCRFGICCGITAIFAKIGVKNIPSNLATLLRTIVIILSLSLLVDLRKEWQNPLLLNKRSLIFLILSAITTGLSWLRYYRARQTGPVAVVAPIDKLSFFCCRFVSHVLE